MNNELTPRELDILRLRKSGKTLEQIGKMYNITRERVRQIEQKALRKAENKSIMNTELLKEKLQLRVVKVNGEYRLFYGPVGDYVVLTTAEYEQIKGLVNENLCD